MIAMANITMIIPPISVRTVETGAVVMAEAGTNVNANPAKIATRYKPASLSHTKIPPSTISYAEKGDFVLCIYINHEK